MPQPQESPSRPLTLREVAAVLFALALVLIGNSALPPGVIRYVLALVVLVLGIVGWAYFKPRWLMSGLCLLGGVMAAGALIYVDQKEEPSHASDDGQLGARRGEKHAVISDPLDGRRKISEWNLHDRDLWLEQGSTLELGGARNRVEFTLTELKREPNRVVQEFLIFGISESGGSARFDGKDRKVLLDSRYRWAGEGVRLRHYFGRPEVVGWMDLTEMAFLDLCSEHWDLRIFVRSVDVNTLSLSLLAKPGTWIEGDIKNRCDWMNLPRSHPRKEVGTR